MSDLLSRTRILWLVSCKECDLWVPTDNEQFAYNLSQRHRRSKGHDSVEYTVLDSEEEK